MGPIRTVKERCRKCYSCIRNCPVKAIQVRQNWAETVPDRCIGCGKCVQVCSQNAQVISDGLEKASGILQEKSQPVAVLGCSYPAFFQDVRPGQLVTALKQIGFQEVHEGISGVELLIPEYSGRIHRPDRTPLITTHCPTVVDLVERHYPQLVRQLMDVVSPMVATGRFIKARHPHKPPVIYISSCLAGKFEMAAEPVAGAVDLVLTYHELSDMFRSSSIDPARLPDSPFDGRPTKQGRLFAISGGPFQAFGIDHDFLSPEFITVEGKDGVLDVIRDLAAGRISPRVVDLRFCAGGCIGGPGRNNRLTTFSKRNLILDYFHSQAVPYRTAEHYRDETPLPFLGRNFSNKYRPLDPPSGERIRRALKETNKFVQQDELDCGACGYTTCREHAVAVCHGFAEGDMCLPYHLKRLEEDRGNLAQKYELARRALDQEFGDVAIVGQDPRTAEVLNLIRQVGPTPTTVLIRGESGTGKELTARAIHQQSQRSEKPLVTVNCTTLTDNLLESELFGHKKGAFTGAVADKKGLFEAANGGTIFLDEIGDITPKLQAELLRVLDSGEIRPVGGNATIKVNVRLIAATNRNLEEGLKEGWFREDLYYRLNVFAITIPPLRSRMDSLDDMVAHFLNRVSQRLNKTISGIEDRAIRAMAGYGWPGNIRELQNVIERAAVLSRDGVIRLENLPVVIAEPAMETLENPTSGPSAGFRKLREKQLTVVEKGLLKKYLQESDGNVSAAARRAGIPRRTFYRILSRHGIKGKDFQQPAKP